MQKTVLKEDENRYVQETNDIGIYQTSEKISFKEKKEDGKELFFFEIGQKNNTYLKLTEYGIDKLKKVSHCR